MIRGALAFVLHAHLPYVRSTHPGSLEEDWFFQALIECYLPLLETLETAALDVKCQPKLTIGLSPTLLSLLSDSDLKQRFPDWIDQRLKLLPHAETKFNEAVEQQHAAIKKYKSSWSNCNGNLISRFASLQQKKIIDILTCGATHGYLPLLRQHPEAIRGQLRTAVREHQRLIGDRPLGVWLPECAYYEGLDKWMRDAGLRYAVLDSHGLLHANPRPRYGIYAPICSKNGVAFFGRDSEATLPIWSAKDGYPGDPNYREFHRDLGWDLPLQILEHLGLKKHRPFSLKLHRVTDHCAPLDQKEPYRPHIAADRVKIHAHHYLEGRRLQLDKLAETMEINPILVAPFDAELFGHWWYEGPCFLAELFRQGPKLNISFIRLRDLLSEPIQLQLCDPSPSSWGQGGYHNYWLNETNAWIVPEWERAGEAMVRRCSRGVGRETDLDLLSQAAREFLLAQSSDWSFILRAGTTTELARERIQTHLNRFWTIMKAIDQQEDLPNLWLNKIKSEDRLFPLIQPLDWAKISS